MGIHLLFNMLANRMSVNVPSRLGGPAILKGLVVYQLVGMFSCYFIAVGLGHVKPLPHVPMISDLCVSFPEAYVFRAGFVMVASAVMVASVTFHDYIQLQLDLAGIPGDRAVHHMKSETNGDPYNFNRGWIFAHIGWVMLRKHPDVIAAGKKLDFSDLKEDPIVMLQHKLYLPSVVLFCYALPTAVGWYFTNQIWASFFILGVFRHLFVLHCTWCVNSLAHAIGHGYRPYNDKINPAENLLVSILALGEGWHNYHHQYPTDYRAAEGTLWQFAFNPSTLVIDSLAAVGLVWDRRSTSRSIVEKHKAKVLAAATKAE